MGNRRTLLLFVLAIGFGLAAALLVRNALQERELPDVAAAPLATGAVVVAKVDLSTAAALQESQLEVTSWPKDLVPAGAISNPSQLTGRVLRYPLSRGEPVFETALLPVGAEAGMVSVISPQKRAVSVKVAPVVGVAGFITPGTRVDVLATLKGARTPQSRAVLQDIPVLAIDQRLQQAKDGEPELVNVVTLEVTPKDSEKLVYAAHNGQLQLALRGPADHEIVQTAGVDVNDLLGRKRPRQIASRGPSASVEVIKGSGRSVKNF